MAKPPDGYEQENALVSATEYTLRAADGESVWAKVSIGSDQPVLHVLVNEPDDQFTGFQRLRIELVRGAGLDAGTRVSCKVFSGTRAPCLEMERDLSRGTAGRAVVNEPDGQPWGRVEVGDGMLTLFDAEEVPRLIAQTSIPNSTEGAMLYTLSLDDVELVWVQLLGAESKSMPILSP